ncbi:MAG: DUF4136 domain-containing protein [Bacteroidales bacterium]|nr:DUF4136 domain-containing protein [Bacteroidales bacterium]
MKNLLIKFAVVSGIALGLFACYPEGVETTSDTDLVYTNYDPDFNFAGVQTYYLADSIQHIVDEGEEPDRSLDSFIISEIESNLMNLGWSEFDTTLFPEQNPDIAVVASLMVTTTYNVYYYPWYPYWGWGWYKSSNSMDYYGYGWYYPWYGTSYVTSYSTGTVAMLMFDPDRADTTNKLINLSWAGLLNGIAGYGISDAKTRITRGINQAFEQSPYLGGN